MQLAHPPGSPSYELSPGLFVVLLEILHKPYGKNQCILKVRQIYFFNLILVGFVFAVLMYFLGYFFTVLRS